MTTPAKKCLLLASLALATTCSLACGNNRRVLVRNPAAVNEPTPQSAFNDPSVHGPHNHTTSPPPSGPESPYQYPSSPGAALTAPPAAAPTQPERKKPMYGEPSSTQDRALAKTDKPLSDAQVIGVVVVANDGEVAIAELAAKKATSPAVKRFAERMKAEHAASSQKTKALAAKTKLESVESDASTYMKDEVERASKDLRTESASAFDRAYMGGEVKRHKDILALVENRLAPSAKSAELKTLVSSMRQELADHLAKAEEIQEELDPSAVKKGQIRQPSDTP